MTRCVWSSPAASARHWRPLAALECSATTTGRWEDEWDVMIASIRESAVRVGRDMERVARNVTEVRAAATAARRDGEIVFGLAADGRSRQHPPRKRLAASLAPAV